MLDSKNNQVAVFYVEQNLLYNYGTSSHFVNLSWPNMLTFFVQALSVTAPGGKAIELPGAVTMPPISCHHLLDVLADQWDVYNYNVGRHCLPLRNSTLFELSMAISSHR